MTPSSSSDAPTSSMVPTTTPTKSSKVLKWNNDESKAKNWKLHNPCTGSDGLILKPPGHKKGKCKNCICCRICIAPPWCQTPSFHQRKQDIITTTTTTTNDSSILQRTLMTKQTSYPTPDPPLEEDHHHHLVKSSTIQPKLSELKKKPIGPQTTSNKCTTHDKNTSLPPRVDVAAAATTTAESGRGDLQGINIPMTAQPSSIIMRQTERRHRHHHQQQQQHRIERKVAGTGKHQGIDSIQIPSTRKPSKESVSLPKRIEASNVLHCRETSKKCNNTNTKTTVVVVHRAMNGKFVGRYRSMEATARAVVKYHPDVKAFVDSYPHKLDMDTFRRGIRRSLISGNTYMGCHFKHEVHQQQQQQQHKAEASNNSTAIIHQLMIGGDSGAATASFKRY